MVKTHNTAKKNVTHALKPRINVLASLCPKNNNEKTK